MIVYVAGASSEPVRVRWAMDSVRGEGWTVAHDWLAVIEEAGAANEGLSDKDRMRASWDCIHGLDRADVVWLLAPDTQSIGVWVELGYAMASGRDVIVSGPGSKRTIFAALTSCELPDDEAAIEVLREYAK